MDPRIREHADVICTHSIDLQAGDDVVVNAAPVAEDLVVALHEIIGDRGARPLTLYGGRDSRLDRAYLRAHDDPFETPEHALALIEETDAYIAIRAGENVTETSDVDPERRAAYTTAQKPVQEARLDTRWCLTQYPGPAYAQLAEMSTEGYENFVWDAVCKDWKAVREHQAQLVDILEGASEVRIVAGEETDISMSIAGNPPLNDYGEKNLPGGEVFTAPDPQSVEGTVHFDKPLYHQGRAVTDVRLEFEAGDVVSHSAGKNEDVLRNVLETDEGARRLGELGFGMNRDIDRFTYNMLFDEKMGDTVHLAVGRAYADTVAAGNERNDSAVHVDMIVDMSEDARIEVDEKTIQRDGTFVFEDGFGT